MAQAFSLNPAITPIPTAAAWIYNQFVQTGTTASSTTITALSTGTSMLQVGQPVSGAGIPVGAVISTISSATQIIISIAATASASGVSLTFGTAPGIQSTFSNSGNFAQPISTATDVPGCDFAIPEAQTLNAGSTFIPAPGDGFISLTSGTTAMTIQLQTGSGSWTSIFTGTASATSTFGRIACDGGNVRINCPTTAGSFVFYRYRQIPNL